MKGAELSRSFFAEVVLPILRGRFADHVHSLSAALIGEGSEVLGYDDSISRDHNFGPRVALLLDDGAYDQVGDTMARELQRALPAEYMGMRLLWTEYAEAVRVLPLRRHFADYLGVRSIPLSTSDWLRIDEQKALELTAGEAFHDPGPRLARIRGELGYYPPGIRLYLLHLCFVRMSEAAGVERTIRRGDWLATHHYVMYFTHFAIRAAHLLAGRFCPYHRWMARSLRELGSRETALHAQLEEIARIPTLPMIREVMISVLFELGEWTAIHLGVSPPRAPHSNGLTLLAFDWDSVLEPLSRNIPEELKSLSPLISPPSYLGAVFDYCGYDGTYQDLLETNLGLFYPSPESEI